MSRIRISYFRVNRTTISDRKTKKPHFWSFLASARHILTTKFPTNKEISAQIFFSYSSMPRVASNFWCVFQGFFKVFKAIFCVFPGFSSVFQGFFKVFFENVFFQGFFKVFSRFFSRSHRAYNSIRLLLIIFDRTIGIHGIYLFSNTNN